MRRPFSRDQRPDPGNKAYRVNERIYAPQVRVVDAQGVQLGVMAPQEALAIARQEGLDLIEVAPNADPPVCRIMDYGQYRYQQRKREREAGRKQRTRELKMITLRPNISPHDLEVKARKLREFLTEGRKVRLMVRFLARQMRHTDLGREVLIQLAEMCQDTGNMEGAPSLEGRNMVMIVAPRPGQAKRAEAGKPTEVSPGAPPPPQPPSPPNPESADNAEDEN